MFPRLTLRLSALILVTGAVFSFAVTTVAAHSDLTQHLNDQYEGKTFILRNFYSGDHLKYEPSGHAINPLAPDDWTVAGVVEVESFRLAGDHLKIEARRLHLGWLGGVFQELHDHDREGKSDKDEGKNRYLLIEVGLGLATVEAADAVLSQIFLTSRDSFADLVPDYWKPCVLAALTGKGSKQYSACRFSQEFAAIPGIALSPGEGGEPGQSGANEAQPSQGSVLRIGNGVAPPKVILQTAPEFSDAARRAKCQGTSTLSLVVDKTGQARNIRISRPLGAGLDQKAVETISRWQFSPATRVGEPVNVEIAVEVDFHLY